MISTIAKLFIQSAISTRDQLKQLRKTEHPITVEKRVLALELLNLHVQNAWFCEMNCITNSLSPTDLHEAQLIIAQMHLKLLAQE